jgi:Raf kinase inhibitor-like YbhB/YbcL family protein
MNGLIVTTPAFEHNGLIPVENTGYGADISPEFHLQGIAENAISIVIIMDDIGHPVKVYNHWTIWNIPVTETIHANIKYGKTVESPGGAIQGRGYGKHRYRGPKPPFNWSHHYQFIFYTLDCFLSLPATSKKAGLKRAMERHILQQAVLIGHYR